MGHLLLREAATRLDGLLIAALFPGVLLVLGVWPNPVRVHLAGDLLFLVATSGFTFSPSGATGSLLPVQPETRVDKPPVAPERK